RRLPRRRHDVVEGGSLDPRRREEGLMDALTAPVVLQRRVPAEEAARADFYALLARLFHDAPDAALLAALAHAPELEAGSPLAGEWRDLTWASRAMDADAARTEYDALFVGVGKAEVSIYA